MHGHTPGPITLHRTPNFQHKGSPRCFLFDRSSCRGCGRKRGANSKIRYHAKNREDPIPGRFSRGVLPPVAFPIHPLTSANQGHTSHALHRAPWSGSDWMRCYRLPKWKNKKKKKKENLLPNHISRSHAPMDMRTCSTPESLCNGVLSLPALSLENLMCHHACIVLHTQSKVPTLSRGFRGPAGSSRSSTNSHAPPFGSSRWSTRQECGRSGVQVLRLKNRTPSRSMPNC